MYKCGDTVEQRVVPGGSNDERVTTMGTTSFVPILLTLSLLISEQRMIPGGSLTVPTCLFTLIL